MYCISVFFALCMASSAQTQPDTFRRLDGITVVADRYRDIIPTQKLTEKKLEALGSFSIADNHYQ
ncbi:MAG: hypothetical protein LBD80_05785 [Tannerella sp.]|nr:hypothetical protein [Tannerella sp.]